MARADSERTVNQAIDAARAEARAEQATVSQRLEAQLARAEARREPLHVVSARPLGDDELATLVAQLGSGTGKRYEVTHDVDASLLGGVRVTIGDRLIDG